MSSELVSVPAAHERKRAWCLGGRPNTARRGWDRAGSDPLVPAARDLPQQALEAAWLCALARTTDGFRRRGRVLSSTQAVRRVRPEGGAVALEVPDAALNDVLAEVLPCVVGDHLVGIPGLRPVPGRKHLDLRVLGTSARVRLLGVTKDRWRQAADRLSGVGEPLWRRADPHESELTTVPVDVPLAPASGVLRRLPLWRGAAWLSVVGRGDVLDLYWRGGPPGDAMAAILGDSCCRVPDVTAVAYSLPEGGVQGLRLTPGARARGDEPEWAWTQWLARSAPGPGAVEAAVHTGGEPPVGVLPHLWEQDGVRDALARREITPLYRLLLRQGVSLDRLVALTGQSRADVEAVVAGRPVDDYDTLTRIAEGLGIPKGYMGLAHDEQPAPTPADDRDEAAKRRAFLVYAARITVGATFTDQPWDECDHRMPA
ncbi:hypothetical protein [Saccharothrix variisporea]|uniref:Uncharacterized protein n=1 Tax=Saccharothrix variisporea TaxID=543527 RepID=A0A495X071_9PSEU|nr:hypothetical protein [Saccharothrix variisporea]RKT67521.1 hypothetical protein DFJ66_0696 [Saccharothrix variisporea]